MQIGKIQWINCLKERKVRFVRHLSSHFLLFPSISILSSIKAQPKPDLVCLLGQSGFSSLQRNQTWSFILTGRVQSEASIRQDNGRIKQQAIHSAVTPWHFTADVCCIPYVAVHSPFKGTCPSFFNQSMHFRRQIYKRPLQSIWLTQRKPVLLKDL